VPVLVLSVSSKATLMWHEVPATASVNISHWSVELPETIRIVM
jgi:hypothetical protein